MVRDQVADLSELNHYETQHVNLGTVDSETMEKLQRRSIWNTTSSLGDSCAICGDAPCTG